MSWKIQTDGKNNYRVRYSDGEFLRQLPDNPSLYVKGGAGKIVVFPSENSARHCMECIVDHDDELWIDCEE